VQQLEEENSALQQRLEAAEADLAQVLGHNQELRGACGCRACKQALQQHSSGGGGEGG
jgi:hypothetical protein